MKIDLVSTHSGKLVSMWRFILATTPINISLCPAYQHLTFPTHVWQRIRQKFCKQKFNMKLLSIQAIEK